MLAAQSNQVGTLESVVTKQRSQTRLRLLLLLLHLHNTRARCGLLVDMLMAMANLSFKRQYEVA